LFVKRLCRRACTEFNIGFAAKLSLWDETCDAELACGASLQTDELPAGTYNLVVDDEDAEGGPFELRVTVEGAPVNDTCLGAVEVELDDGMAVVLGDTTRAGSGASAVGCGLARTQEGADVVFRVPVDVAGRLEVLVQADFQPALYLRDTACADGEEAACGTWSLQTGILPPGDYFLFVDSERAARRGEFALTVSLEPADPPGNDTCGGAEAVEVPVGGGRVPIHGTLADAIGDYEADGGACAPRETSGPDVVYGFRVDAPIGLTATVESEDLDPVVFLTSPCGLGQALACGGGGGPLVAPLALAPGDYALVVDAPVGPHDAADFDLTLDFSPLPAHHDCLQPAELVLDEAGRGEVEGSTAMSSDSAWDAGCGGAGAPDLAYALLLEEAADLDLEVDTDVDLVFHLSGAACGDDLVACGPLPGRVHGLPAGLYHLQIDGLREGDAGPFSLHVETEPTEPREADDACREAEILRFLGGASEVAGNTAGREALLAAQGCGEGTALSPELAYALFLDTPSRITVRVAESERPVTVYLVEPPCDPVAEVACGAGPTPLADLELPAGEYVLVVDGSTAAGPGAVRLEVEAVPFTPGDGCDQPIHVGVPEGAVSVEIEGNTEGAEDDLADLCGAGADGPDVVYRLDLAGETLVVAAVAEAAFDVKLSLTADCGQGPALACGSVDAPLHSGPLPAGSYYLAVDGAGGSGEFALTLELSPLPALCDEAPQLEPGEPVLGDTFEGPVVLGGSCGSFPWMLPSPDSIFRLSLEQDAWLSLTVDQEEFEPVFYVLDDCDLRAAELACHRGPGTLILPRVAAGDYWVVVDGLDGDQGRFRLRAETRAAVLPVGGDECEDRHVLEPAEQTGRVAVFGSTLGREDSFDAEGFCWNLPAAPDSSFGVELERPTDVEVTLTPFGFPSTFYLVAPECHDGRAPEPWDGELGEALLCEYAQAQAGMTMAIEEAPAGSYTLVVDSEDGLAGDFALEVALSEAGCLAAPAVEPGVPIQGSSAGQPDRFSDRCAGLGAGAGETVFRLPLDAPSHVVARVTQAGFQPGVSLRAVCSSDVPPVACAVGDEAEADLDGPGDAWVVVDSLDGGAGAFTLEIDLNVDPRDAKCQVARDVIFAGGEAAVGGGAHISTHETAALEASGCNDAGESAAAPEAVYRLLLEQPAALTVEVVAIDHPGIVYLLRPPCGELDEVACGTGPTPLDAVPLDPGTYYLVVDALGADGPGAFELALRLE